MLFLVPVLMPPDVITRNRTRYEVATEVIPDQEDTLYEKKNFSISSIEKTDYPTESDPASSDKSLLSPTAVSPQFLRVHAKDPTKRTSWIEATVAMEGGDPSMLVVERMTTV